VAHHVKNLSTLAVSNNKLREPPVGRRSDG
jgi:hypothetical protein